MMNDITGLIITAESMGSISLIFGVITILFGVLAIWKPHIISYLFGIYLIVLGVGLVFGGLIW